MIGAKIAAKSLMAQNNPVRNPDAYGRENAPCRRARVARNRGDVACSRKRVACNPVRVACDPRDAPGLQKRLARTRDGGWRTSVSAPGNAIRAVDNRAKE